MKNKKLGCNPLLKKLRRLALDSAYKNWALEALHKVEQMDYHYNMLNSLELTAHLYGFPELSSDDVNAFYRAVDSLKRGIREALSSFKQNWKTISVGED